MRIVIVGGGFAGINFAKQLAGKQDIEIILIDRNNYHFFPPLLYQVATSFIEPSNISYPFRKMFQNKGNIYFHYGSLVQINSAAKNIETTSGKFDYDFLVLAMGTETNFFGMANVEKNALPMKNIDDALQIRNHLLIQLEKATRIKDVSQRQKLLNIVIAGGGPTGVEVSGMLAEMSKKIVYKDYPEFKEHQLDIYLIDAADKLLGSMSQKSQKEALATFSKDFIEQASIQVKYDLYIEKEKELVKKMSQLEELEIPETFDYKKITSLGNEAREKLSRIKPRTLGQASRISGINPSDVQILMVFMGR